MMLLHSLVEGAVHYASGSSETTSLDEFLMFVEHRFAAGALIAFSFSWAGTDLFNGVAPQTAHIVILLKLIVAGLCLSTPKSLASASTAKPSQQSTGFTEESDSYIPLL